MTASASISPSQRASALRFVAGLACAVWFLPSAASQGADALMREVPVHRGEMEIDAGQTWSTEVIVPALADDEVPVLGLRARLQTLGRGGCNYVLQVLVDGVPLAESTMRPRLLNKAPWFDPPGTSYHFSWYGPEDQGWMTIFSPDFESGWGGTGKDFEFLFDLSGVVAGGQTAELCLRYLHPDIPAALGADRAPLVVDRIALGALPQSTVDRLRSEALKGMEVRAVPVEPELPSGAEPGQRAYEIVWSGREESPRAQVAFDDLRGWTLHALGDASVSLSASVEQLLWRPQLAKLSYGGGTTDTVIELRPPAPILIPEPFDAANLWLYGGWNRSGDTQQRIVALLQDAAGREYQLDLGSVTASYWGMQHGVLPRRVADTARFPLSFTALRISGCKAIGERRAYLESLAFYRQERRPPAAPPRPRPSLFPTSDDGMLPTPPEGAKTQIEQLGLGALFTSEFRGAKLQYRVHPEDGCLNGVVARWNDGRRFRPMAGGDVMLDRGEGPATVVSSRVEKGVLRVRWRQVGTPGGRGGAPHALQWEADYSLRGCTLVVDVRCTGGAASGLTLGHVAGLRRPRGIEVPYLLMGPKPGPWIACADELFCSVLPDWYNSDFSAVDTAVTPPRGDRIGLLRGTTYGTLTDGRRNPLRDRILVTVSSEFADTLPNARNPVSPNRERLAPYLFYMADQLNPNLYTTLKRHGIDHVIASDFACILVANNYGEGFAARWRPHPSLTLQQVQDYRQGIKSLGYLFSTYMDVTDYFPGSELWDENKAVLGPDGDLVDGWWGNYLTKPAMMPRIVQTVGRKSQEAYPSDCVYLDVHTNRGPTALDFEAGAPGAGIAKDQVIANGDCILEARKWYGSTISEGLYRWMYAGLSDMDYATLITTGTAADLPPLVDFDLLKIHPFQHGTMMGHHPDRLLGKEDLEELYKDKGHGPAPAGFYKYVAASLAYGHMAILGYWYTPPLARFVHHYALLQGVQSEYLTDNACEIRYHDGDRLVPTSRALAEGTQSLGRVYVRYTRGLRLWVNCSAQGPWVVETGGRRYELPPHGWLIEKPGSTLAFSALVDGRRVDFVRCPEYLYINTGGARASESPLEVEGAVLLKRESDAWRLIPCGDLGQWERFPPPGLPSRFSDFRTVGAPTNRGCPYIAVDTKALLGKEAADVRVVARDEAGGDVPAKAAPVDAVHLSISADEGAVDYTLR